MSTCTKWVTQVTIGCKNWTSVVDHECTTWADEGSSRCSEWAEEGSDQCSQWADEGSNQCSSWEECGWFSPWNCVAGFFCLAWYWVAKWVCKAWYWVAKWICKAWYWVAKWVCKVFAWVVKAVCVVLSWAFNLVCVAWDTLRCALLSIWRWLTILFGGGSPAPRIEHVFVLMLENRSFDHMFGFSGITGVDIEGNPTAVDGSDPERDKNVDPTTGAEVPVSTPADFSLNGIDKDPGHEFGDTLISLCGAGAKYEPVLGGYPPIDNSGFIENYQENGSKTPERIMDCYDTTAQLPVLNKLASEFAICDQWFSSLPGPTWPNRFFLLAASSGGLDGSPSPGDIVAATTIEGYRFANGNIFDLLDQHCIDWKIFEGDDFPVSFAMSGMNLNALQGRFEDFAEFDSEVNKTSFSPRFVFIEPKYGSHSFDLTGPGDFTCGDSMHPLDDVTRGERLVKEVYEAIRNSPLWERSMLVIAFDEHGGFYDHVKPPAAVPPGDTITQSYVQNHFQFDQLGVRVPAVIVSPLIEKGVIDHTQYDHTSMLATVERLFGMGNLTERDKAANDFLHLLSLDSPREDTPSRLPEPAVNKDALPCDDDSEHSKDELIGQRSELRIAQRSGLYRQQPTTGIRPTSTQVGFVQVALLKVLQTAEHPARERWIEQYKAISTGVDAALFMTEAKLKLRHGIDFKRLEPEAASSPRRPAG